MSTAQNTIAIVYDYEPHSVHQHDLMSVMARPAVSCFTVMRKSGGLATAVYNPDDPARIGFRKCCRLVTHSERVKHIAPSDFRPNTHLRMLLEQMVEEIADWIVATESHSGDRTIRAPLY